MSAGRGTAAPHQGGAATPDPDALHEGPRRGRGRRDRLDAYELAVLRGGRNSASDPLVEDDSPPPLPKLRIGNFRVGPLGLAVGLLGMVFIATQVRYGGKAAPPGLAASCDTPALAISATTVRRGEPLRYTTVGPAKSIVLAIDVAALGADHSVTPLPGRTDTQVIPAQQLRDCKATGILGVQVQPGEHTVSVFPATGGGPLASRPLTVTDR